MTSTVNLRGGLVSRDNGVLAMATIVGTAFNNVNGHTQNATLNLTGGTITIGNTAGVSIPMADVNVTASTASLNANATLNVAGADVTLTGHITRGLSVGGTSTATLNLSSGVLNMSGQDIGATGAPLDTLAFTGGTLRNLGSTFQNLTQTGGTFERTVAGTSTINGSFNASSTGTALVQVSHASGILNTTSGFTAGNNATLKGIGTVGGSSIVVDAGGRMQPGGSIGTLSLDPGAANTVTFNTNAILRIQIDDGSTPSGTAGGSSVGTFPALTSNSAINQITGTVSFASTMTVEVDGTAATFTPDVPYSYQIGAVAGQDLSGLSLDGPGGLTVTPIGGLLLYPTYSVTGAADGRIFLNFTVVPEPVLLGIFLMAFGAHAFRSRRSM